MAEVRVAHTADLNSATLRAARTLLDDVFVGEMTDHDWEHALGGMHAIVWESGQVVGHGSVVQRRLLHRDRALRTGYIEGVAVRADRRGSGYGAAVMESLERIVRGAYDVGALGSSETATGFYAGRGWKAWRGQTWALTPDGRIRTEDEDGFIFVFGGPDLLDIAGELTCDWREGDVW